MIFTVYNETNDSKHRMRLMIIFLYFSVFATPTTTTCLDTVATNTPSLPPTTSTGTDPIPVAVQGVSTSKLGLALTISVGVDPVPVNIQDIGTSPPKKPEAVPHQRPRRVQRKRAR